MFSTTLFDKREFTKAKMRFDLDLMNWEEDMPKFEHIGTFFNYDDYLNLMEEWLASAPREPCREDYEYEIETD